MKWVMVQVVDSAEAPSLAEGQAGLCCCLADVRDQRGNQLLHQMETEAYAIGKQVQRFLFTQQVKRWTRN